MFHLINNHNKKKNEKNSENDEVYLKIKNKPEGKQQIIMVDRDSKKKTMG